MRLFVALEIPEDHRESLWRACQPLRDVFPRIRWVPQENLHLTLKFLGSCSDEQLAAATGALASVAAAGAVVRWDGIGGFPSTRRATTVWAGVSDPAGAVPSLASMVEEVLSGAFAPEERAFRPHVTLARASKPVPLLERPVEVDLPGEEVELREISLFRSHLGPDGPRYERLETWRLELPGRAT